jgi:general L-amino acid transport system permease protein
VSLVGIVFATLIGVVAALGRLSTNWLVNKIASLYIEIVRNIPLLVQLFFWYFAIYQRLPPVKESILLPGPVFLSQRGMYMTSLQPTSAFGTWLIFVGAGMILSAALYLLLSRYQMRTGRTTYPIATALVALIAPPVMGWFLVAQPFVTQARLWASSTLKAARG